MRITPFLFSIVSIVFLALSVTSFAQDENPFGTAPVTGDPFNENQVDENPFGIQPQVEEPVAEDPFAPQQQPAVEQGSETKNPFGGPAVVEQGSESKNPFGGPTVEQGSETKDPFGGPAVEQGSETKNPNPFGTAEPKPVDQFPAVEPIVEEPEKQENPFGERSGFEPEVEVVREKPIELPAEETFEEKFWMYLKSNAYENWAPVPGTQGDFYVGSSPHGAFLKMYLNRVAAGNPATLPVGSIIVKENYSVDRSTLKAITVMYHSKGYNSVAGDWYWVKFNPDGTVANTSVESGSKPIAGKVSSCIDCHSGAEGDDFTFFNDK